MAKDDYEKISDNPTIVFLFAMVTILLTVFTVFANGVVVTAVVYAHVQRKHRGQTNKVKRSTAAMLLMTSMSVVDFVVGLVVMPMYIPDLISNGKKILDSSWSCARYVLDVNFCTVSIYHVVVMATDRYLAVCRPLVYKVLPLKVTWVMLVLCWTMPALIYLIFLSLDALPGEMTNNSSSSTKSCEHSSSLPTKISMGVLSNLPMSLVYVLYFLILLEVYRFNSRRKHFFGFENKQGLQSNQKASKINGDSFEGCSDYPKSPFNKTPTNYVGKNVLLNTQTSVCIATNEQKYSGGTCGIQKISRNTESVIEHSDVGCHNDSRNGEDVSSECCKDGEDVSSDCCQGGEDVSSECCKDGEDVSSDCCQGGEDVSSECCKDGEDVSSECCKDGEDVSSECCKDGEDVSSECCKDGEDVNSDCCQGGEDVSSDCCKDGEDVSSECCKDGEDVSSECCKDGEDVSSDCCKDGEDVSSECCKDGEDVSSECCKDGEDVSRDGCNVREDVSRDGCNVREDVSRDGCKVREDVSRDGCKAEEDVSHDRFKKEEDVQHKDIKKETLRHQKSVRPPAGGSTSSVRAVKTIGEIVLCFTLCWMPLAIYYLIKSFHDIQLPYRIYQALSWLGFLNSAINPVLLYNNLSIRASVKLLIFPTTKIKP